MIKFILLFSILASFVTLNAQDFSEKNDDGVLLYYNIISDSEPYAVEVTRLGDWYSHNNEYQFDSIVIPERVRYEGRNYDVTQIGFKAFAYCDHLAYIKMGNSIKNIEEGAFHSCKKLTKVVYPDSLISIGSGAFLATSIKEAILPATLQYLGESAFYACDSNAYVYIGALVSIIGESPFSENQALSHIDVDPTNQWYCSVDGVLYNKSQSVLLQFPGAKEEVTIATSVKKIAREAFSYCSKLKVVNIPSSIDSIGEYAFFSSKSITDIQMEDHITHISNYAFCYCTSLQQITLPDSLTMINEGLFHGCSALVKVELPKKLKTIKTRAFLYCFNLEEISLPSGVDTIDLNAFTLCSSLSNIFVSEENRHYSSFDGLLYNKDKTALLFCPSGKKHPIAFAPTLTIIEEGAFMNFTGTKIEIPNMVTIIKASAFRASLNLKKVTIPNSVTLIEEGAFADTGLKEISLPSTITTINSYLMSLSKITKIKIPESVTHICQRAFSNCYSLKSVTIPSTVQSIGAFCFNNCRELKKVTCLTSTPPHMETPDGEDIAYFHIPPKKVLRVPKGSEKAYSEANYWKEFKRIKGVRVK